MLGALARSRDQQQQLVQDAGHELRTPLTSLRTNVAVLRRIDNLAPEARQQLVDDLDSETKELTALVNELVELATDRRDDEPAQECDLAGAVRAGRGSSAPAYRPRDHGGRRRVAGVVPAGGDRSGRRQPHRQRGQVQRRAASGASAIEVDVDRGRLSLSAIVARASPSTICRTSSIASIGRSPSRSLPGSGLGLAIVRDIVESHGGTVFAEARDGGGTTVGFTLPTVPTPARATHPGRRDPHAPCRHFPRRPRRIG